MPESNVFNAEAPKKRVVIYFQERSGDMAKALANRLRANDPLEVVLTWGVNIHSEQDILGGIAAVLIAQGPPNGAMIAQYYAA